MERSIKNLGLKYVQSVLIMLINNDFCINNFKNYPEY
jgi:hypothetical protein